MRGVDHFSLVARFYDRFFAGYDASHLRDLLALPAGRLLDVGGGTGRVTALLADQVELAVVADASPGMLAEARPKAGLSLTHAHVERLPFPDNSFDRVLVVDAFHHFARHEQAAYELVRVVKPGGRLVVEELNVERLPVKLIALGERLLLMGSHFYGPDGLRRLFERHGGRPALHVDDAVNMWVVMEKELG
jgi:ubiquinone/menaquinone biosynthesis C-methylase UbiE